MIATIIIFAFILVSWSVALTLLLHRYLTAARAYETVLGGALDHIHNWTDITDNTLLRGIAALPALTFDASPAAVELREVLLNSTLRYLTTIMLVVERRLSNRLTLMTELLSPFYVSLTKQQIPEKFVPQYLQVEEPKFDAEGAIEVAETKVRETLLNEGKLIGESQQKDSNDKLRCVEVVSKAQALHQARKWLFMATPILTAALIASLAAMLVLASCG